MQEFFSFNFPLREYFFVIRPPPKKFSNGPSLRKVMAGVGGDFLRCIDYFLLTFSLYEFFRSGHEYFFGITWGACEFVFDQFPLVRIFVFLYFAHPHAT